MTDLPLYPPAPRTVHADDQRDRCDGPRCDGIPCALVVIGPDLPACFDPPGVAVDPDGFLRLNLCPDCAHPFVDRAGIDVAGTPVPLTLRWYA